MCKYKSAILAYQPRSRTSSTTTVSKRTHYSTATFSSSSPTAGFPTTGSSSQDQNRVRTGISSGSSAHSHASSSSASSLASLRDALPEKLLLFPFSELCAATNNFQSKRLSSSSSSARRCSLRGKDAVILQRPFRGRDSAALRSRLAALGKSHHSSLIPLLGASLAGDQVYLVYEYAPGASLADCLRNARNPTYTLLSSWFSRIQVATDLAQGLEYIHHHSSAAGGIHNRVKSSALIVTEPGFRTKICHFGAADLAGEIPIDGTAAGDNANEWAASEDGASSSSPLRVRRSGSRKMRIEGTRGYMAPELLKGGQISRQSDVYAFGVVLLELLSGEEPLKYRFDQKREDFERVSLIETARGAIGVEDEGSSSSAAEERRGRVRRWVDQRLKDSFPVGEAEKLIRVALWCLEADPAARPDMTWVAGRISMIYLDSKVWNDNIRVPTDISVSIAPR